MIVKSGSLLPYDLHHCAAVNYLKSSHLPAFIGLSGYFFMILPQYAAHPGR
jgi:hypothetical protein